MDRGSAKSGIRSLPLLVAAFALLIGIGIAMAKANADLLEANRRVTHTYEVRGDIDRFVSEIARMESTVRAYALTGGASFRDRYAYHRDIALQRLDDVQRLVADNPPQLARTRELRALAEQKFEQSTAILEARTDGGAAAAARALDALPTTITSALVNLADTMEQEESQLLIRRTFDERKVESNARLAQAIGSLSALALLAAALVAARQSASGQREAEQQLLSANATLAASEERFRHAFEFAGIGMALVGIDGAWMRVNSGVCDIVGYTEEQLLRMRLQDLTHPEDMHVGVAERNQLMAGHGRFFQLEKRYIHRDGHPVWVKITASLVRDRAGDPAYFVAHIEDISQRKRLEADVARARDEALEASRMKSQFIANISHEIRTPMNAIMGMAQLLLDTKLDEDQKDMARMIQSGADSLLTIINDLLDFSKIETGRLRLDHEPFDLRELIEQTLAFLTVRAHEKKLVLEGHLGPIEPLPVVGDAGRIRQVLTNLVANAIKFTPKGRIDVALEVLHQTAASVRFRLSVRDSGIGIPREAQARLFQPFTQAEASTTRRFGGTGLGLAICRQIAELMGGKIGFASEPDKGSTFWFEAELVRPGAAGAAPGEAAPARPAPAPARPPVAPGQARPLHLLLAEDNGANQIVARRFLAKMGHSVDIAADGQTALEKLAAGSYDAVLMDCQMPVMDGFEAARRIRAGLVPGVDPHIPIIAVTAYAMPEDRVKCEEAGMDGCITKPVQLSDLSAAFRRCGLA